MARGLRPIRIGREPPRHVLHHVPGDDSEVSANRAGTILADLVDATSGEKGKWFAAAKSAGLLAEAAELARTSPCDPRTLTRAARDFAASKPEFARTVGLAALQWLLRGHGYEVTAKDAVDALNHTLEAARHDGAEDDTVRRIQLLVDQHPRADGTIIALLRRRLEEVTKSSAS